MALKDRSAAPSLVVSVRGLPELRGIRYSDDGTLHVGAATTYAELATAKLQGWHAEVSAVAGNLADRSVRNIATVGGAACQADPRYDVPTLLVGVGATLRLVCEGGERLIPASRFFETGGGTCLKPCELLTTILFPPASPDVSVALEKFRYRSFEAAILIVVCALSLDANGVAVSARLTVGAVAKAPLLAPLAVALIIGRRRSEVSAGCSRAPSLGRGRAWRAAGQPAASVSGGTGQKPDDQGPWSGLLGNRKAKPVMHEVSITVNGRLVEARVDERMLLIDFIRDVARLTGTHAGCLEARCGCCAVELDGRIVKACNVLACQADGGSVATVESLSQQRLMPVEHITTQSLAGVYKPVEALGHGALRPLQEAFHQRHALQCGFCTPGMLMVLKNFLEEVPDPTREDVRVAISGNLCRCTGYQHIVDAAMDAARAMRGAPVG